MKTTAMLRPTAIATPLVLGMAMFLPIVAASTAAQANEGSPEQRETLSSDQIRRLVTGKRIYLATPLGGEIPLFYAPNGTVDGSGEAVGLGRWLKPTDSGRWWVENNRLCQQWTTWYKGERMCFTLTGAGDGKVTWRRDNGETGIARLGR